ncbi:thrombospondin type 3 repeat-containing protein [Pontibacter sp. BT731]|uniref:outer membrane beta-barrel protein n=1 Tax=Pontibacter coccineus TaxID=3063328 RepID=UPI0026E356E9|nr:outer membrane beta-barrel protein [Pontibacter sp. BT731]MDO6388928.1 thrombospondin type 3 repeat-containing protein [Pontibacter sp. BT731]
MNRSSYFLLLLFSVTFLFCNTAQAQNSGFRRMGVSKIPERGLVIQAGAGLAAVKSDICGSYGCNEIGSAFSIGALFKYNPFWSFNGEVEYLKLSAVSKDSKNITIESRVIDVSGMLVYNLMDSYAGSNNYRSLRKRFAVPFVKGGIGFVYYTPSSYPTNRPPNSDITYDRLRSYPAIAGVIPIGGGIRFRFSDQISIAPEVMYHLTTTDYLDNNNQSQNNKDHYGVVSVKLLYTPMPKNEVFTSKRQGIKPFKKKK